MNIINFRRWVRATRIRILPGCDTLRFHGVFDGENVDWDYELGVFRQSVFDQPIYRNVPNSGTLLPYLARQNSLISPSDWLKRLQREYLSA